MSLIPSNFGSGKKPKRCCRCGANLPFVNTAPYAKCSDCSNEIAKQVEDEFKENIGHYATEAIMTTGNEELISSIEKGAKILSDNKPRIILLDKDKEDEIPKPRIILPD